MVGQRPDCFIVPQSGLPVNYGVGTRLVAPKGLYHPDPTTFIMARSFLAFMLRFLISRWHTVQLSVLMESSNLTVVPSHRRLPSSAPQCLHFLFTLIAPVGVQTLGSDGSFGSDVGPCIHGFYPCRGPLHIVR